MLLRLGLISVLGLLPISVGCFRALAYPEFPSCPGTTLPTVSDEVCAVRVDVCHERPGPTILVANEFERHTFTRIDVSDGKVPAQRALSLSYWWVADSGETKKGVSRNHAVMLKVYRRGYQTLIIRPGAGAVPIDWSPAPKPNDQVAAIRAFAYEGQQPPPPPKPLPGQPAGTLPPAPTPGQPAGTLPSGQATAALPPTPSPGNSTSRCFSLSQRSSSALPAFTWPARRRRRPVSRKRQTSANSRPGRPERRRLLSDHGSCFGRRASTRARRTEAGWRIQGPINRLQKPPAPAKPCASPA